MSQRKKFHNDRFTAVETTFYGFDHHGTWYFNGCGTENNGEKLHKRISVNHWRKGDIILDIYFDADNDGGLFKIKAVRSAYKNDDEEEVIISNINNCPDNDKKEWIPHFIFGTYSDNKQKAMFASIPVSWYGIDKPIEWE